MKILTLAARFKKKKKKKKKEKKKKITLSQNTFLTKKKEINGINHEEGFRLQIV